MPSVVLRGDQRGLRKAASLATSACFHGGILAWVIFGGLPERSPSAYDAAIRPHEKKLIWYRLSDKLPEIGPTVAATEDHPLRARAKSQQSIVAGPADDQNPAPLIWSPDVTPAIKPVELPNLVTVAPSRPLRPFVTPPDIVAEQAAPKLAEPPQVGASVKAEPLPFDMKSPKPAPRAFVPPPDARMARQAALELPEAPAIRETVVEAYALPFTATGVKPRLRDFVPPGAKRAPADPVILPDAPETTPAISAPAIALPKTFVPPPKRPEDRRAPSIAPEAPAVESVRAPVPQTTLAIVGLYPANIRNVPPPPESRSAGFSAGPAPRKEGASATPPAMELLNVPGLGVRGLKDSQPVLLGPFSPTSRENLIAAARGAGAPAMKPAIEPRSSRMVEAPDPMLAGRVVYSIAIQMPNVTSYSGSWQVWFAEREPLPGSPPVDMVAPDPMHKVDPKYVASAAAEHVEGTIRLSGVIRKDGHVDHIALLRHLDDRLDRTVLEALSKWEFAPALRNGNPVDVDAVFEIPFRLVRLTR